MRRVLVLAKRDYLAVVRTKAFIIGLVAFPLLFGGGAIGSAILQNKSTSAGSRRIAILDHTQKAAPFVIQAASDLLARDRAGQSGGGLRPNNNDFQYETVAPDSDSSAQLLDLSGRIRRGELFAVLDIDANLLHPPSTPVPQVNYYGGAGGIDTTQQFLAFIVNDGLHRARLAELGVSEDRTKEALAPIQLQGMALMTRDPQTGAVAAPHKRGAAENFAVPFVTVMLLAMIVLIGASPMLSSVAEDKLQRVYEMLLGTATPFELMAGKVLAGVGQSLTSSIFYIIGGLLVLQGMALFGLAPLWVLPWFFVYLVAEVTMLSAIGVALGASCGSPQDAQHLVMFVLGPVIIPLITISTILQQPNGTFATAMSLFPLFTPIVMMLRQTLPGGVPAWQPWVALAGILIATPIITWGAARVFRVAVLAQGQHPNMAQLLRWAVRG